MRALSVFSRTTLAVVLAMSLTLAGPGNEAAAAEASIKRAHFADLPGWTDDDHLAALKAFEQSCTGPHPATIAASADTAEETRGAPKPRRAKSLVRACTALVASGGAGTFDGESARAFFERWFEPVLMTPKGEKAGRVTAYFEPQLAGSVAKTDRFAVPLFALPKDLVSVSSKSRPAGFPENLSAARRTTEGLTPYSDRGALADPEAWESLEPLAWIEDPVDAYFVHIQGSVRLALPDGSALRLGFAGKNGHPYASAGKEMIRRGLVPAAGMSSKAMSDWLKANPEIAPDILAVNPSYIFFRKITGLTDDLGPIGAEGVPLTRGRSLAVDPRHIGYGMPVYVTADLPTGTAAGKEPFRRLMIAQDTGSAIRGPARGDLFWGTGEDAGDIAGRINDPAQFYVLRPRDGGNGDVAAQAD
ncbi:murein transglycosylase A [Tepidamorphus sp. 3E244]|uniref:murein transglycosylase A n=1 Tax=Tepidamorphus sp. 3E244 TaxID=3385498 RepID=UPI0038FD0740